MSEMARTARAALKAKAHRIAEGDPHAKVDASGWTPPEALNTEAKTGLRPVSKRAYKRGGHVVGHEAHKHAGRKPRKGGGPVRSYAQDDTKADNAEKFGNPHVGGRKEGGRAKKAVGAPGGVNVPTAMIDLTKRGTPLPGQGATGMKRGGHKDAKEDAKEIRGMVKPGCIKKKATGGTVDGKVDTGHEMIEQVGGHNEPAMPRYNAAAVNNAIDSSGRSGRKISKREAGRIHALLRGRKKGGKVDGVDEGTRPTGGRKARADGGRAKKGTTINIVISAGQKSPAPPMMPPGVPPMGPPPGAPPMPPAGGPPTGGPPMPPPGAMPRQRGGRAEARTTNYMGLESGSGSGLGRLQKAMGKKP